MYVVFSCCVGTCHIMIGNWCTFYPTNREHVYVLQCLYCLKMHMLKSYKLTWWVEGGGAFGRYLGQKSGISVKEFSVSLRTTRYSLAFLWHEWNKIWQSQICKMVLTRKDHAGWHQDRGLSLLREINFAVFKSSKPWYFFIVTSTKTFNIAFNITFNIAFLVRTMFWTKVRMYAKRLPNSLNNAFFLKN